MSDEKPEIPFQSVVLPEVLSEETEIPFRCYPGISCFNACCRNKHLPLSPYDVLRLKRALRLDSDTFLVEYAVYALDSRSGFPVISYYDYTNGDLMLVRCGDAACTSGNTITTVDSAEALASLRGRDYVLPDDVKSLAVPVLSHRIILKTEARLKGRTEEDLLREILESVPVPTE